MKRLAAILVGFVALAVVAGWTTARWAIWTPVDPSASEIELEVPSGASATQVGRVLAERGLIRHPWAWQAWLRLDPGPTLKAGRHRVSAAMNVPELRMALASPPLPDDEPFTVLEGWRRVDTDRALAEGGWAEPGAYLAATESGARYDLAFEVEAPSLEGYLFPETYAFVKAEFEVEQLVARQLQTFTERFVKPHRAAIEASSRSLHTLVTVASMLEREEPEPSVRPKVAGVLYKRLDSDHPLGVDATSRYRLDVWNDRRAFLAKLRDEDDPYNTRLRVGLPPTPIGAPGLASLRAALEPEASPYWYYLHDAQQQIHFARTAAEHEANRRKFNVW